ncbi:MAG: GNAT family N-acetyltransferase [Planctomycetes bacterium]|nr:GNAT family N-acetyltransferase [Planctomycetota bacterium]
MGNTVSLITIERDGTPRSYLEPLPHVALEVLRATSKLYESVGFEEPWVGYLALANATPVGTCAFKSPPRDGRVEIAYFTFPGHEGSGLATAMAAQLVVMARQNRPSVLVAAQTLPERNASHRILEKLGFRHVTTLDHPEDGTVWEWHLAPETESQRSNK